jgi:membrane-associated phospholipid phosphatase
LIELDLRLTERLRIAEQPGILRTTSAILAHSGDSWYWLGGLGILWWLGTEYWKVRAVILIITILMTAGLVFVVKRLVPRRRPEGDWGKFYRKTDPGSFPSGHTARAFMLAVIMLGLGPFWLGLILLIWAPLVGLARVAMGVHYLSDVLAGSLLGILIGGVVPVVFVML